ncbi:GNAT family N-acetyltransferase [Clostridium culturomicium]|uniref:GNAT family N-acetyltransferase n=1 Tax=Clostridium culturomicium TaxID=1499683 RepID=UPI0005AACEC2|nr:GNAT family protein [Clostridium culturomicium]
MGKGLNVTITNTTNEANNYIIKASGIITGRFTIIDLDNDNKSVLIKLKFFKDSKEGIAILEEALRVMLQILIKSNGLHKVNILCDETISLTPFTNLGFQLEGYIAENSLVNSKYEGNLIMGMIEEDYYNNAYIKEGYLKGDNIEIRVLSSENADELLDYYVRNRSFLSKYEPFRDETFFTLETQRQSLIENYREFIKGQGAHFGIYKDNIMIGRIRINNIIQGVFKSAFIGYSIDEKCQGKGYMKEAVKLVLKYAYEEFGLHRIEATTLLDNERSQRVLEACGFTELGVCKEYLLINGKWRDHKIFYRNNK